jgi:filamentous hemagglutinin family protein
MAYFNNPAHIHTILTRVTGKAESTIDGLLRANGTANLWLLNPNGIAFGANARLQIGGSLVGSTASRFTFPDGSEFSAVNPQSPPLLAVNLTPGLQTGKPVGNLSQAGNLAVEPGQHLTLQGNTVSHTGLLRAPRGRIEVIGDRIALMDNARIDVSAANGGGTVFIGGAFQGAGTLPTASRTFVAPGVAIQADAFEAGDGGTIVVWSNEATRFYGMASARGGTTSGNGGLVEISGKNFLDYQGRVNTLAPRGTTGTLLLDPTNIEITNATINVAPTTVDQFADPDLAPGLTQINPLAFSLATSNVVLQATNTITFRSVVTMLFPGVGMTVEAGNDILFEGSGGSIATAGIQTRGGNVSLIAGRDVRLSDRAFVRTDDGFGGDSGNITVQAGGTLNLRDGQLGTSTTGAGNAGTIAIKAADVTIVSPVGTSFVSSISASTEGGSGHAGKISINTGRLTLENGAQIAVATSGAGDAGEISIQANTIEMTGESAPNFASSLLSNTQPGSTGNPGKISLDTQRLTLLDGAGIYAGSLSAASGGELTVRASEIELAGKRSLPSTLSVGAIAGLIGMGNLVGGDAGTLSIATDRLVVRDGATIEVSALDGTAGRLSIQATDSVSLQGAAALDVSGSNGGTIVVAAKRFQAFDSELSAVGADRAGTISLTTTESATLANSRLSVDSIRRGGQVVIDVGSLIMTANSTIGGIALLGEGTNISVKSRDDIRLNQSLISSSSFDTRAGGNIAISTEQGRLQLQNGSAVFSSTIGRGNSGNITVNVADGIDIAGDTTGSVINPSVITTTSITTEASGNVDITARSLTIRDGGQIATTTFDPETFDVRLFGLDPTDPIQQTLLNIVKNRLNAATQGVAGRGVSGNLTLTIADAVTIQNSGNLSTAAIGKASGGNLSLQANSLLVQKLGVITSTSLGSGFAGDIRLNLATSLQTNAGVISATADQSGGGNIAISAKNVFLRNGSLLSSSVFDSIGGGGNIDIRSRVFVAIEDSDVLANAEAGPGGTIFINSPGFLADFFSTKRGTAVGRNPGSFEQFRGNGRVDISADSRSGTSGTVSFPVVDPNRGAIPLPIDLLDSADQINQACTPQGAQRASSLVMVGRGGLPSSPYDLLQGDSVLTEWLTVVPSSASTQAGTPVEVTSVRTIVEAQGWIKTSDGYIVLVAGKPIASARYRHPCLSSVQPNADGSHRQFGQNLQLSAH